METAEIIKELEKAMETSPTGMHKIQKDILYTWKLLHIELDDRQAKLDFDLQHSIRVKTMCMLDTSFEMKVVYKRMYDTIEKLYYNLKYAQEKKESEGESSV
jgi:hypothetical protein